MFTKLPFLLRRVGAMIGALAALASANSVHAFSLTAADVIGFVVPATPAEPGDETARLQYFIDVSFGGGITPDGNTYTLVFGANVPFTLPSPASFGTKITTSALPVTLTTPYAYLMAKFGPDAVYYYLGGQTGVLESLFIPAGLGTNGNGLSHISLFNPTGGGTSVPDGGSTAAFLGGVVSCLVFLRRRFAR